MPEHLIHRQLDLLRGAVGEARMAARDLERKQARARTALEQAHATVVEALAEEQSQPKLKIARKQEDDARAALAEHERSEPYIRASGDQRLDAVVHVRAHDRRRPEPGLMGKHSHARGRVWDEPRPDELWPWCPRHHEEAVQRGA